MIKAFYISDITNGKSYAWEWEKEIVNINSVYISYSYHNPWVRFVHIILFPLLFGGIVVWVVFLVKEKSEMNEKLEERYISQIDR